MTAPEGYIPVDLEAVQEVVGSYVTMRFAMVSSLRRDATGHGAFIRFCNDQSSLLNQALGTLDETALHVILRAAQLGVLTMEDDTLDEAFEELLLCQIAYLAILRQRKAAQN